MNLTSKLNSKFYTKFTQKCKITQNFLERSNKGKLTRNLKLVKIYSIK